MEKLISKETELNIAKLGIYQIVGGALGILLIIWAIISNQQYSLQALALFFIISLFFAFSIYCGILCTDAHEKALSLSYINQILQVLNFVLLGYAFKYVAGVYIGLGIDFNSWDVVFNLGLSSVEFNFNNDSERLEIVINLVAVILFYIIDKLKNKVKQEKLLRQAQDIGQGNS